MKTITIQIPDDREVQIVKKEEKKEEVIIRAYQDLIDEKRLEGYAIHYGNSSIIKFNDKDNGDPKCGEIYQISLGDLYVDKYREAYDLLYYTKYSKLLLHIGLSEEDEIPKIPMIMKFEETELIIDWILKGTRIKILPLYDATDYD